MAQAVRWLDAEYQRDQEARAKDKKEDGRRRRALVFNCSAEKVWHIPKNINRQDGSNLTIPT